MLKMRCSIGVLMLVAGFAGLPSGAAAQQRPLVTEDPETVGAGQWLIEAGLDYGRDQFFPLSGLKGDLLRVPLIGATLGLGTFADLQVDFGLFNRLSIKERLDAPLMGMLDVDGDTTTDVEDITVATKIRVLTETERRPALGVRFATRLPNAGNESGLGLDTTDFLATMLGGKTVRSIRIVGNLGVGILSDPTRGDRQNDVLLYGVSVARAVLPTVEFVGEINGRADTREGDPPPGTENRARTVLGARYTRGPNRLDAGIIIGMTSRDPDFGFTAGYTRAFQY